MILKCIVPQRIANISLILFEFSMSQSFLRVLGPLIFVSGTCLLALMITDLVLMSRISTHIQDITRLWKDQPIVSIYASSSDNGLACSAGFEALSLDQVALPSVSQASCGCTKNVYGYSSSVAPCFAQGEHSGYCMSLNALDPPKSFHWRGSTLCIKRAGRPAATYKGHYAGRSHPDKHGKCPNHYKKCGDGRNQDEGAICFPTDSECPITNIMILPVSDSPPADEEWEPAGFFLHDQSALFVRREHIGELPIMNLTVALAEVERDLNVRGQCYQGESQHVQEEIQASKRVPWTYHASLPPVCETSDPRYKLADRVSLANGYLRSLQASEPACAGFQLFSLNDPRYNKTSDPDYLNSGVKCGSDPRYVCVRDSNQRTDCVPGDSICDGVVNQNICGAYTHAVRSAFHKSSATLGLYYVREIQWSDYCEVSKRDIFNYRKTPFDFMQRVGWGVGLFFFFSCILFHAPLTIQEGETAESTQASHVAVYVWFVLSPMFVSLIAAVVEMCKVIFSIEFAFLSLLLLIIVDSLFSCLCILNRCTAYTKRWTADSAPMILLQILSCLDSRPFFKCTA